MVMNWILVNIFVWTWFSKAFFEKTFPVKSGKDAKWYFDVKFFNFHGTHEILEVGILQIDRIPVDKLTAGDVGYLILNIKDVSNIHVGDTVT